MLTLTFFFAGLFGEAYFQQPWLQWAKGTPLASVPYLQDYTLGEAIAVSSSGLMGFCIVMA